MSFWEDVPKINDKSPSLSTFIDAYCSNFGHRKAWNTLHRHQDTTHHNHRHAATIAPRPDQNTSLDFLFFLLKKTCSQTTQHVSFLIGPDTSECLIEPHWLLRKNMESSSRPPQGTNSFIQIKRLKKQMWIIPRQSFWVSHSVTSGQGL